MPNHQKINPTRCTKSPKFDSEAFSALNLIHRSVHHSSTPEKTLIIQTLWQKMSPKEAILGPQTVHKSVKYRMLSHKSAV